MKNVFIKSLFAFIFISGLFYSLVVIAVILYSNKNYNGSADAALVFGAAQWNNKPSPVLQERINHSINLLNAGKVKYILFTGGYGRNSKFAESIVSKEYSIKKGIPPEKILFENISNSTIENIYYALKIGKINNINSFILVSDPEHILRCAIIADYFKINFETSPTNTTKIRGWSRKIKFAAAEGYYIIKFITSAYIFRNDVLQQQ